MEVLKVVSDVNNFALPGMKYYITYMEIRGGLPPLIFFVSQLAIGFIPAASSASYFVSFGQRCFIFLISEESI